MGLLENSFKALCHARLLSFPMLCAHNIESGKKDHKKKVTHHNPLKIFSPKLKKLESRATSHFKPL